MDISGHTTPKKKPARQPRTPATTATPPATPAAADASLPRHRTVFKKSTWTGIVTTGIVICFIAWLVAHQAPAKTTENTPDYQTVLPASKTIESLGGWKKLTPPNGEEVFVYNDTIKGVAISVSQQPLPASFRANAERDVAELAKSYNATTKIKAGSTTVYIGTSTKGPQSVIFTKEQLLVLIKSQRTISNDAWTTYVQSLSGDNLRNVPKY